MDTNLNKIFDECLSVGLSREELLAATPLSVQTNVQIKYSKQPFNLRKFFVYTAIISVLYAVKNPGTYLHPITYVRDLKDGWVDMFVKDTCALSHTVTSMEVTRPVVECSICKTIKEVCYINVLYHKYFNK